MWLWPDSMVLRVSSKRNDSMINCISHETLWAMMPLWGGEKGLTEAGTWDPDKSLSQETTKNPAKGAHWNPPAWLGQGQVKHKRTGNFKNIQECSGTYSLLNAVFKVSKNECNVSCKGNIWNKYIAFWNSKGQNFFQLQEHKTGIIPWTPAWENYLAPNLCLEMCSSFTWVRERESHKRVREEWHFDSLFKNMFNKTSTNCGQSYKKNNW